MAGDDESKRVRLLEEQLAAQHLRIEELERAARERDEIMLAHPEALRALQREQEFTRVLLEHVSEGVVACDADGNLVLFNRTAREWHGVDVRRLKPHEWANHYDLYGPDRVTPLRMEDIPLFRA